MTTGLCTCRCFPSFLGSVVPSKGWLGLMHWAWEARMNKSEHSCCAFQTVKNEVNIPVLKKLVEDLYSVTVDMTTKRKHTLVSGEFCCCEICFLVLNDFLF